MRKPTEPTESSSASVQDRTKSDGFAAIAVLGLTIAFIVAIIVFAIA